MESRSLRVAQRDPNRVRLNVGDLRWKCELWWHILGAPPISHSTDYQSHEHLHASLSQDDVALRPANWHADWYYNYTGQPWTKFGSFVPDFREGHYFDIGVVGFGSYPWAYAFFYQLGVASKTPVPGWSVQLLYPSFVHPDGSWRLMERANIIQGWHSYWKANYRWGGQPYNGVSALASANDENVPLGVLQLSYIVTGSL